MFLTAVPALRAQVDIRGQVSPAFIKSQKSGSQYSYDRGRAGFIWRADLFLGMELSSAVLFLSNLRLMQDEDLHIDLLALRFLNLAGPELNADVGVIEVPFLALGDRWFPKTNSFLSLPLAREHFTTLRISDGELWNADSRYTRGHNGYHVIDGPLYDIGLKIFGSHGILAYEFAVTNGSVSAGGTYAPNGSNSNHGIGKSMRIALTVATGTTVGLSFAWGPFLHGGTDSYYGSSSSIESDPAAHSQEIIGVDIEYGYDHFTFYGEGFLNRWKFTDRYGSDLRASGFSAEVKFVPAARFSIATRVGGLFFNDISTGGFPDPGYSDIVAGAWDNDLLSLEGGFGYRFSREVLIKAVYRHIDLIATGDDPPDDTVALQIVASF